MKNTLFIVFIWLTLLPICSGQHSFSYSPDSSALSILLDKVKLDSVKQEFTIDLKGKWKQRKSNHITIDIRGQLVTPNPIEQVDSIEVNCQVYGKTKKIKIDTRGNYILRFKRTGRQMLCKPKIIITTKKIKPGWELYIDAIDMAVISSPKNKAR